MWAIYFIYMLMYFAAVPSGISPPAILLRESFRDGGKVRTRTLANLTSWAPERIDALRRTLKGEFDGFTGELQPVCGFTPPFGDVGSGLVYPAPLCRRDTHCYTVSLSPAV